MRRKLLFLVVGIAVASTLTALNATARDVAPASHADVHVIRVLGVESFEANALIYSTFRFDPGRSFPHQGDRVRLVDQDRSGAPHTLTVVRPGQIPDTIDEIFECDACNAALEAHFSEDPPVRKIGLEDGLNEPGDSLLIFDGQAIGADVTAPPDTVLYFVCAFHPWMQGRLVVG